MEKQYLIKNVLVVTVNKNDEIIENGAIVIQGDKILDIGKTAEIEGRYKVDKEIEVGLINQKPRFHFACPTRLKC